MFSSQQELGLGENTHFKMTSMRGKRTGLFIHQILSISGEGILREEPYYSLPVGGKASSRDERATQTRNQGLQLSETGPEVP